MHVKQWKRLKETPVKKIVRNLNTSSKLKTVWDMIQKIARIARIE